MSGQMRPYADLFVDPKGPGDIRPTALKVAQDAGVIGQWAGKVVLITGATSGIGIETARTLFATGADIYITARSLKKGEDAVKEIINGSQGKGTIGIIEMDLTSLDSVKKAVESFLAKSDKLNILINNAGIMAVPELARTVDGFEEQFGVNYLAHYVLTALLLPTLIKSSTPSFNSRVIPVTSSGHGFSSVNFDDINFSKGYHPWVAYGQSKTGLIWLSNYIDRVYGSHGVHANAVHPGAILTPLLKHIPADQTEAWSQDQSFMNQAKSPEQGAATTVWAAVASVWEGQGGHYLSDCGVGKKAIDPSKMEDEGFASHAFDVEGEDKLWKLSAELAGIKVEV